MKENNLTILCTNHWVIHNMTLHISYSKTIYAQLHAFSLMENSLIKTNVHSESMCRLAYTRGVWLRLQAATWRPRRAPRARSVPPSANYGAWRLEPRCLYSWRPLMKSITICWTRARVAKLTMSRPCLLGNQSRLHRSLLLTFNNNYVSEYGHSVYVYSIG